MLTEFDGKVAVVTGAASGIGRAMCEKFAALGMRVVMADVEAALLQESADQIEATGAEVLAMRIDVSRADELSRPAEGIKQDRFYLIADEDTNWHAACLARLEDIRLRRNPTFGVIAGVD